MYIYRWNEVPVSGVSDELKKKKKDKMNIRIFFTLNMKPQIVKLISLGS